MKTIPRLKRAPGLAVVLRCSLVALLLSGVAVAAQTEGEYSYFRSVEGAVEIESTAGSPSDVEPNYPALVGDRLWADRASRADLLLSDGGQLSIDSGTELVLEDLAYSPDTENDATVLRLIEGRILLNTRYVDVASGDATVIDTANVRVYVQDSGIVLITTESYDYTEITVREGFVEVVDQRGSSVVRAGETLEVQGDAYTTNDLRPAIAATSLEQWAYDQEALHARDSEASLEEPLYSTASLSDHGDWVTIDSRRAWKPYVTVRSWRPYYDGRWVPTSAGLYWVSYDPWSPVVYHYGDWDYHPRYGWLWYPGYRFAPAHVYWYWGPQYAGWVPTGYYSRFYRPYYPSSGLRFGIYGYVGGGFDAFFDWTFCPLGYLRYRRPYRYYRYGHELRGHGRLDRGLLTTDTRYVDYDRWRRPELVHVALEKGWRRNHGPEETIPDVTPFVERKPQLPRETARRVLAKPNPSGRILPPSVDPATTSPDRRLAARRDLGSRGGARPGTGSGTAATGGRTASGRQTVSRESSPDRGDRSVAPRATAPRRPTVDGGRREPARRVLDGIRGRSRSGESRVRETAPPRRAPVTRSRTGDPRSSVRRDTYPRPSGSSRTPVTRSNGGSRSRPSATTPRSGGRRSTPSARRAPPSRRPTASRPTSGSGSSRRTVTRPPSSSGSRSGYSRPTSRGSSSRSVVRRPSGGSQRSGSSAVRRSSPSRPTVARPSSRGRSSAGRSSVTRRSTPSRSTVSRPSSRGRSSGRSSVTRQRSGSSRPSASSSSRPRSSRPSARSSSGSRRSSGGARARTARRPGSGF